MNRLTTQNAQWRVPVLLAGSLIIVCWTLLRFFTQPIIFDAVGQQVLAHQWLHGLHSGSITGPTNYIFKMLLVYMPVDLLPGNPRLKLILVTIAFNLVAFLGVFLSTEVILRRFKLKPKSEFWLISLWTAVLAGSIYWIGFANSRNIEVAAGATLIAIGLSITKTTKLYVYGLSALFCSLLFFADPLQAYMTALPLLIFMLLESWRHKRQVKKVFQRHIILWAAALGIGLIFSKLLIAFSEHLWHVHFFAVGTIIPLHLIPSRLATAIKQFVQLYSGSADLGRPFFYFNPVLLLAFLVTAVITFWLQPVSRKLLSWAAIIIVVDMIVYVVSGQSALDTNARYLIMTLPAWSVLPPC